MYPDPYYIDRKVTEVKQEEWFSERYQLVRDLRALRKNLNLARTRSQSLQDWLFLSLFANFLFAVIALSGVL